MRMFGILALVSSVIVGCANATPEPSDSAPASATWADVEKKRSDVGEERAQATRRSNDDIRAILHRSVDGKPLAELHFIAKLKLIAVRQDGQPRFSLAKYPNLHPTLEEMNDVVHGVSVDYRSSSKS